MAMSNAFTTPVGVAAFPYLSTPDTKFNEEGEYKVNLILTKEDAQPVITQIDSVYDENVKEQKKKLGSKPCKEANRPYADELDQEGNPTGKVIIKFKSKAAYKPAVFDAKGTPMLEHNIYAGSEMKVNGAIAPYYTSMVGAGVSLRLRAVQVIQYVEGTSGAGRFGFDEEVGYVQEKEETKDAPVSEDSKSESDF